jgi:hypothetical protein
LVPINVSVPPPIVSPPLPPMAPANVPEAFAVDLAHQLENVVGGF